jgi:rfaE bifunctional protein nucleotidyltransferase chain/domain
MSRTMSNPDPPIVDDSPYVSDRRPRGKIRSLAEVALISEQLRSSGKRVVQCHGTFDLLHLGHVRHLEAARQLGDCLIVTVTADTFVNKGPGRPVFDSEVRAEMLASLEFVDWVVINDAADAVNAITQLRPTIYVKGQDYEQQESDVTGKIAVEREAVEDHGGSIHFTDEVTFSSSQLINQHLNIFEPDIREHLDVLRDNDGLEALISLIASVSEYRVLLIGDSIIDEYQYVEPMGKTPKENVIAARYESAEVFAGGVLAAANHLASFCKEVEVITCLGDDGDYADLVQASAQPNVTLTAFERSGATTTVKRRFVDSSRVGKLFEVYMIADEPLPPHLQQKIDSVIAERAGQFDLVVVTDFGHGMLAPSSVDVLTGTAPRFLAVNTQTNTGNYGYNLITKYRRADYVCIDAPEARLATGDRFSPVPELASRLANRYVECPRLIITHGRNGCVTYERGKASHTIPAFARRVVDTIGAGDAFFVVTAPLVAAGGSMHQIGFIGNVVGALKVQIIGHRKSVDKPSLIKSITGLLK